MLVFNHGFYLSLHALIHENLSNSRWNQSCRPRRLAGFLKRQFSTSASGEGVRMGPYTTVSSNQLVNMSNRESRTSATRNSGSSTIISIWNSYIRFCRSSTSGRGEGGHNSPRARGNGAVFRVQHPAGHSKGEHDSGRHTHQEKYIADRR